MKKFVISRNINGISINGKENLLTDDGHLMTFDSIELATNFLKTKGYSLDEITEESGIYIEELEIPF